MLDIVDQQVESWKSERPDLDMTAVAVVNRIGLLSKKIKQRIREALAPLELEIWEFEVLSALRRQGEPFELPPSTLAKLAMLTTGAMTNRIDRLEARKLVERKPHPEDRRGLYISLTEEGLQLVDKAVEIRSQESARLMNCLGEMGCVELGQLLRKLMLSL